MLRYGTVAETKPGFARVKFEEDGIVSFWLPVLQAKTQKDKFYFMPDVNEFVACLMDAQAEDGVVLGALYNDEDLPTLTKTGVTFSDGTSITYDVEAGELEVSCAGDVKISCKNAAITAQAVDITSTQTTITGALKVTGMVAVGGLSAATAGAAVAIDGGLETSGDMKVGNLEASGDVKAGSVSLSKHTHSGVTTGTGASGTPIIV